MKEDFKQFPDVVATSDYSKEYGGEFTKNIIKKSKRNPGNYYIQTSNGFLHAFCSAVLPTYQNLKYRKRKDYINVLLIQLKLYLVSENKNETHKSMLEFYGNKDPRKNTSFGSILLNSVFFTYYKDVNYIANISNKFFDVSVEDIEENKEIDFAYMCFLAYIIGINVDINDFPAVASKNNKVRISIYHNTNYDNFSILAERSKDGLLFVTKFRE